MLDELATQNYLLRRIAVAVDFGFIHDLCKDLYCSSNGRPAVEPEVLFKMLFVGYLFGIKSETRLVEKVECNVAYRWFLGVGLRDKVPDHATILHSNKKAGDTACLAGLAGQSHRVH